jgi:hypothetical protein
VELHACEATALPIEVRKTHVFGTTAIAQAAPDRSITCSPNFEKVFGTLQRRERLLDFELNVLQLILVHPKIVPELMYDSSPDLGSSPPVEQTALMFF